MITAAHKTIAIAGIHTGIGKTIAAAVIAEALQAHYWKPIQAGLEERDTTTVQGLITAGASAIHPEAVKLQMAASPHTAAAAQGIDVDYTKFVWPQTSGTLLVETAGGVLSPFTATQTVADFIAHFQLPAILVSQNYLGSINHTLTAIESLKNRGIKILGIVMNGETNQSSEAYIEAYASVPIIARIPHFAILSNEQIKGCARQLHNRLINAIG